MSLRMKVAATVLKIGAIPAWTWIGILWFKGQGSDMSGVKVYVVVAVLFSAGDQVPKILFADVVGKSESASPLQIAST